MVAVSDAVVVEVARVGDERLIISETLRLSLNVEIFILRTKKNIICDTGCRDAWRDHASRQERERRFGVSASEPVVTYAYALTLNTAITRVSSTRRRCAPSPLK